MVGIGNSGGDIAVEISRSAEKVRRDNSTGKSVFSQSFAYACIHFVCFDVFYFIASPLFMSDVSQHTPRGLGGWQDVHSRSSHGHDGYHQIQQHPSQDSSQSCEQLGSRERTEPKV